MSYQMSKEEVKDVIENGMEYGYATSIELPIELLDKIYSKYDKLWNLYTFSRPYGQKTPIYYSYEDLAILLEAIKIEKIMEDTNLNIECCFYIALYMYKKPYIYIGNYNDTIFEKSYLKETNFDDLRNNHLNYFINKMEQFYKNMETEAYKKNPFIFRTEVLNNIKAIESLYNHIDLNNFEKEHCSQLKSLIKNSRASKK